MSWEGRLHLSMSPGSDGGRWRVESPLSFCSSFGVVTVLPGFSTDGASIPRFFWRLIGCPLRGRYAPAAVIHDSLYHSHLTTKHTADLIFYEALLDLGVKGWRSKALFEAVDKFGKSAWDSHPEAVIRSIVSFEQTVRESE